MSASPQTYLIDRVITCLENELNKSCGDEDNSIVWFSPDLWLSYPNDEIQMSLETIKNLNDPYPYSHLIIQILNNLNKYALQKLTYKNSLFFQTLFHIAFYFTQIPNDLNAKMISTLIISHDFFNNKQDLYKSCISLFIKTIGQKSNYQMEAISSVKSKIGVQNIGNMTKILIAATDSHLSLLYLIESMEYMINRFDESNYTFILLSLTRVFAEMALTHQKELISAIQESDKVKIKEIFNKLYSKLGKSERSVSVLAFLIMFILYGNPLIDKKDLETYKKIITLFKKLEKSKYIDSLFLGTYLISLTYFVVGDASYRAHFELIKIAVNQFLKSCTSKLVAEKFPNYMHIFGALEYQFIKNPKIIESENLFIKVSNCIISSFPTSKYLTQYKSKYRNIIFATLSGILNVSEEDINQQPQQNISKESESERCVSIFLSLNDINFELNCQKVDGVHEKKEATKDMALFFEIFENTTNILNFISLFLKVYKNYPEKVGPRLSLFTRNLFIPWKNYFDIFDTMREKEISSFLYNVSQNFLSVFPTINLSHFPKCENIQIIYQEFLNFCLIICTKYIKNNNIFYPLIQSITDTILIQTAIFSSISKKWLEKVNWLANKITAIVYNDEKTVIQPSEQTWKELVKIPFKFDVVLPTVLSSVMSMLSFTNTFIDEFRLKYTNLAFSENSVELDYLQSPSKSHTVFATNLMKSLHEELRKTLSLMSGNYVQKVLNIAYVANSIVKNNEEIAKNDANGDISILFFCFLMTDSISHNNKFKELSLSIFEFIDAISPHLDLTKKYNIILLLTDVMAYNLRNITNDIVLSNAVKSYSYLTENFQFYKETKHASVYSIYMGAREDIFYILRILKRTALELTKLKKDVKFLEKTFSNILHNNFVLCSDYFFDILQSTIIDNLSVNIISQITKEEVINQNPKVEEDKIISNFVSFEFNDILLEINELPEYHSAAVDYAWFYGKNRQLLDFVVKNGNERVKNLFFTAYLQRCGADIDYKKIISAYEKSSAIDFAEDLKLNEEFEYFFKDYEKIEDKLALFQTFFILSFFATPYRYGVYQSFDRVKSISFVDSLKKSKIFSVKFEHELSLHRPLINTPNLYEVHEKALKFLPYKKVPQDNVKDSDNFGSMKYEEIVKMRNDNIMTIIPNSKKKGFLISLKNLKAEDICHFADFFIGHLRRKVKYYIVVDLMEARILDFDLFHSQVTKIYEKVYDQLENVYLLNLTKNSAGFLNNYKSDEWVNVISVLNNINDIFEVYPDLILPLNSVRHDFEFSKVTLPNDKIGQLYFSRRNLTIEAPGNVLTVPDAKRIYIIPFNLITKIVIIENVVQIYFSTDKVAKFSTISPEAISRVIDMKRAGIFSRQKFICSVNRLIRIADYVANSIKMISSKSHDIGASAANLFTRLTSSNYLEFVGAKFTYPSQEWCIKRLKMIPEKYEIFARFIEMIRDEIDAPFYLSKGLPLLSEQEIVNLMNRLSKDGKFEVKLWSKTPIEISSIVLRSTINVTEKFSVEIANISLEGVTKFIYDEKITPKMLKNTVESLPSIIIVASKLPENFEAEIFIFVLQQFTKIESIGFEYLSLAESMCVRYRLPLNVCGTEADKKRQRRADEIYSYIIRYRKICEISNCVEVFDNYFRGKKDPLSILVRTLFDNDLEQLSTDCLDAFQTSDVSNSGYLFVTMSFLLDKIPLKVSSYFDTTVQFCTRDCKMSADLMMKCLSMDEYLVGENITKIVLTLKDIFRNIITKSDALKLLKMIRQSQHLTQEQSGISAVPLVAFDLDDAFPVSIKPTPFAFSFLFDVMISGCLSVKQMHRVLDFFAKYKSSIDDEMKANLFNELCTLMSVENTIETSLKLTNLLKLLST